MLNFPKYILKLLFTLSFLLLLPSITLANASLPTITNPFDSLQVKIPGMAKFSEAEVSGSVAGGIGLSINWIAEYIMGVYSYAIGIIGVLAVLAIAIGGVMWILSFGNPSQVTVAKEWITGAILGLVLALGSYILLNTISVDLVRMRPIYLGSAGSSSGSFSGSGYSDPGDSDAPVTPFGKLTRVLCPDQKYMDTFPDGKKTKAIAHYFAVDKKVQTKYVHPKIPAEAKLRGLSDSNTSYFDCSAFAAYINRCLGRKDTPGEGSSYNLFRNPNINNNRQPLTFVGEINGQATPARLGLQPGDIIGYNDGKGTGHVMTYIGENMLVEAGGTPPSVRNEYGAIKITDFRQRLEGYIDGNKSNGEEKLYYIKR